MNSARDGADGNDGAARAVMLELTIVADDLTGAADTGAPFAEAGIPTFVALAEGAEPGAARVVAVDTDTRRLTDPGEAGARVEQAARRAWACGTSSIYKKLDSTLRGHVGAEAAAVLRATASMQPETAPVIVASPAFPAMGRTVRGGTVLVGGVVSAVERDATASRTGNLARMLREAGLATRSLDARAVRGDVQALASCIEECNADAVVCDAETEDDLAAIASAGARVSRRVVWLGSAGLARHLATALRLRCGSVAPPDAWPNGPILVLVGSRSGVALEQARHMTSGRDVVTIVVDPSAVLEGERDERWRRAAAALDGAIREARNVVLRVDPAAEIAMARQAQVAASLGKLAAASSSELAAAVATGGDTARGLLTAIGARGLRLVGEIEPGVAFGLADDARALPVVTKAGAFGDPGTLQRITEKLEAFARGTRPSRTCSPEERR